MAEKIWERIDPMVARWKKFTGSDDGERLAAVEHSPTSELQRYLKEFGETRADIDAYVATLEKKYGVFETGELGADAAPESKDVTRHQSLLALRKAYEDALAELEDREATGEV